MQLKKWSNGVEIREVGLGNKQKNECVHIFLHEEKGEASMAEWEDEEKRHGCPLVMHLRGCGT